MIIILMMCMMMTTMLTTTMIIRMIISVIFFFDAWFAPTLTLVPQTYGSDLEYFFSLRVLNRKDLDRYFAYGVCT